MKINTRCRVCGNKNLAPIINLGEQRLSGVFPHPDGPQASKSPLEIIRCDKSKERRACGLVQLKHSADLHEMYGATYGYYSSISPTMVSHLEEIGRRLLQFVRLKKGDIILDIGCNDGTLLNCFRGKGVDRVGIDPSSEKFASNFHDDIEVAYKLFSEESVREIIGDRKCNIITSIAMFYDIDDPIDFMKQIKSLLTDNGIWALELSYFPLLLTNLTYDQICHEHVTYPSLTQMSYMMEEAGLKVLDVDINYINGGSFFIIAGHKDGPYKQQTKKISELLRSEAPLDSKSSYDRFHRRVKAHRDEIKHFFSLVKESGKKIYGYGASTKGNVVLNFCNLGPEDLPCISDRNPEKVGLITPGTGIPIISHEEMREEKPEYLFVLIWHFRKEVIEYELEFLKRGGKLVFHLPRLHTVDINNHKRYLNSPFEDLSFPI